MEGIIKKFGTLAAVAVALVIAQVQMVNMNQNINKVIVKTDQMNIRYNDVYSELRSDDVIMAQMQKDIERLNDKTPTVSDWFQLKNQVIQLKNEVIQLKNEKR